MSTITIRKASITAGQGLNLVFVKRETDGSITDSKSDYSAPVHSDLKAAFRKFDIHLGLLAEYIKSEEVVDIDKPEHSLLESFKVGTIEFDGEDAGVKISGTRELSTGKSMPCLPPLVKWGEKEKRAYTHESVLAELTEQVKHEITAYLGGKHAPELQPSLFGSSDADEEGI